MTYTKLTDDSKCWSWITWVSHQPLLQTLQQKSLWAVSPSYPTAREVPKKLRQTARRQRRTYHERGRDVPMYRILVLSGRT